jgi:hypothetical protein
MKIKVHVLDSISTGKKTILLNDVVALYKSKVKDFG